MQRPLVYDLCELRLHKRRAGAYLALGNETTTTGWREVFKTLAQRLTSIYDGAIAAIERLDAGALLGKPGNAVPPLDLLAAILQSLINAPSDSTLHASQKTMQHFLSQAAQFWAYVTSLTTESSNLFVEAARQTALSLGDFLASYGSVFVSTLRVLFEGLSRVVVALARKMASLAHTLAELCGSAVRSVVVSGGRALMHVVLVGTLSMLEIVKLGNLALDDLRAYTQSQTVDILERLRQVTGITWESAAWLLQVPWVQKIAQWLGLVSVTMAELVKATLGYLASLVARVVFAALAYLPEFVGRVMQQALDTVVPLVRGTVQALRDASQTLTDLRIPMAKINVHVDAARELLLIPEVKEDSKQRLRDSLYAAETFQRLLAEGQRARQRQLVKNPREMANKINAMASVLEELSAADRGVTDSSQITLDLADDVMTIEYGMTMEEFAAQQGLVEERLKAAIVWAAADLAPADAPGSVRRRRPAVERVEGLLFGNKKLAAAKKELKDTEQEIEDAERQLRRKRADEGYRIRRQQALAEAERLYNQQALRGAEATQRSLVEMQNEQLALVDLAENVTALEERIRVAREQLGDLKLYAEERESRIEFIAGIMTMAAVLGLICYYTYQYYKREEQELQRQRASFDASLRRWSGNDPWVSKMMRQWKEDESYRATEANKPSERLDAFREFVNKAQMEIADLDADAYANKEKMREYELVGREVWRSFTRDAKMAVTRHEQLEKNKKSAAGHLSEAGIWIYEKLLGSWSSGTGSSGADRLDIVVQESLQARDRVAAITSGTEVANVPALVAAAEIEFPTIFGSKDVSRLDPSRFLAGVNAYRTQTTLGSYNAERTYLADLSELMRLRIHTMNSALDSYSDDLEAPPSYAQRAWQFLSDEISSSANALMDVSGFKAFDLDTFLEHPYESFKNATTSINPSLITKLVAGVQCSFFGVTLGASLIVLAFWSVAMILVGLMASEGWLTIERIGQAWTFASPLLKWGLAQMLVHFTAAYMSRWAALSLFVAIGHLFYTIFVGPVGAVFWGILRMVRWSVYSVTAGMAAGNAAIQAAQGAYGSAAPRVDRMLAASAASQQPDISGWTSSSGESKKNV